MRNSLEGDRDTGFSALQPQRPADARTDVIDAVIVSDVRLYREGLALGLDGRGDVRIAGAAETLDAACALLAGARASVVILDTGMPKALDLARHLLRAVPSVRIVAVAVADESGDVIACAEAGLSGYVLRDGSMADVAAAIRDAMLDELHCSPRVSATLFKRLSTATSTVTEDPRALLTPREEEVVALVDRGLSNKQIGQRLRIGTATVKNHVHNILEKLQVTRRAEAAAQMRSARQSMPRGRSLPRPSAT